jgi:hypothetical protein
MATTNDAPRVPVRQLVLVPAILTLAVTLVRLAGELLGGPDRLFSRAAGGAGALIGIVWLVPVFGYYFGHKLTRGGFPPPSLGKHFGLTVAGFGVMAAFMAAAFSMPTGSLVQFALVTIGAWAGALLVWWGWRALGSVLIAYGLAARIPVALVMLAAILGDWGTHYDVPPPDFPEGMGKLAKWVAIGLVPQLTIWIGFTAIVGGLFAGIAAAIASRRGAAAARAA